MIAAINVTFSKSYEPLSTSFPLDFHFSAAQVFSWKVLLNLATTVSKTHHLLSQ